MNTPPLLMFATLAFWGWRTEWMIPALVAGLLLEGSRFVSLRWEFSLKELRRINDLCILLILGGAVYTYFSESLSNPTFAMFQWLPLLFLPLMLAQAYGHLDKIPLSTFLLASRFSRHEEAETTSVNISHAYFGICLLAASVTNERGPIFLLALGALLAWALWPQRSRRFTATAWLGLLMAVVLLGHAGAAGLHELHLALEGRFTEWMAKLVQPDTDPIESRTSIGQIGELKLSGRIVLRVEAEGPPPELLRKASYDLFRNVSWFSTRKNFTELHGESAEGRWRLIPQRTPRQVVTIAAYLPKGSGVVALPQGTAEIDELPVIRLMTNWLGAVQGVGGPGLVRYIARYGPGVSLDGPTSEMDITIPDSEREAIELVAGELGLANKSDAEVVRRITAFFREKFTYATYLRRGSRAAQKSQRRFPGPDGVQDIRSARGAALENELSPLSEFLLKTRAGHCEYFASASVLLLRQAGIPARYITGYAVQESVGQHKYVARERDAHAWVIYFDRATGFWRDLDTTPPSWRPIEAANAAWWEPIRDFFSRAWYEFSKWRWLGDRAALQRLVFWLLIPLAAILTYRLVTAKRRARGARAAEGENKMVPWPGLDSEFYLIEQRLTKLGWGREPAENFSAWISRLRANPTCPVSLDPIAATLELHYRHRFDPAGLAAIERTQLRDRVGEWMKEAATAKQTEI